MCSVFLLLVADVGNIVAISVVVRRVKEIRQHRKNSAPIIVKMAEETQPSSGILTNIVLEIVQSPLNIALVSLIAFLIYKIIKSRQSVPAVYTPEPQLPKIRKDFTVEELKKYDGTGEDGRVLVAVNGNVYDVTRGKRFYGPGM